MTAGVSVISTYDGYLFCDPSKSGDAGKWRSVDNYFPDEDTLFVDKAIGCIKRELLWLYLFRILVNRAITFMTKRKIFKMFCLYFQCLSNHFLSASCGDLQLFDGTEPILSVNRLYTLVPHIYPTYSNDKFVSFTSFTRRSVGKVPRNVTYRDLSKTPSFAYSIASLLTHLSLTPSKMPFTWDKPVCQILFPTSENQVSQWSCDWLRWDVDQVHVRSQVGDHLRGDRVVGEWMLSAQILKKSNQKSIKSIL